MKVLFASNRPLVRAENITAVWNAYKGDKDFTQMTPYRTSEKIIAGGYDLLVTDEFVSKAMSPVIMIGHGISGGKTFGLDQPHKYYTRHEAKLITKVVTTSPSMIGIAAKQSGVSPDQVLAYGMPRTDAYIGAKKGDGKTGLATHRRVYLYAPTFRSVYEPAAPSIDFELIDRLLTDDEIFIVKNHMWTGGTTIGSYGHIVQVSPDVPSAPFLIDCDVLITDYSSIMFDAHVLKKPVVLFEKDEGRYVKSRGMYRPYPEGYSSRHVTDEKDLVRIIRTAKTPAQEDIRCRRDTARSCDGHSTERVIKLIEDMLYGHEEEMRESEA